MYTYDGFYQDLIKINDPFDYWEVISTYIKLIDELNHVVSHFNGDIDVQFEAQKFIMEYEW